MFVTETSSDDSPVALRVRNVAKTFPGTVAVDGVDFDIGRGEVHALVGGNGSGKSTIIKILAGVIPADTGAVVIGGASYELTDFRPKVAQRHGLHFVHQHPTTFLDMTVAENLALGRGFDTTRFRRINWHALRRRVDTVLQRFGIPARPEQRLGELGPATQTMVVVARALQDQADADGGVLVLDEPTSALPPDEATKLLGALRRYASMGQAVLFVSHRLDEVLQVADRVTVLRDGQRLATIAREGLTRQSLVDLLVGGSSEPLPSPAIFQNRRPVLEVAGLAGGTVRDVGLRLAAGEVVGIAGTAGSGRSALLRLLFGVQTRDAGTLKVQGEPYAPTSPRDALAAGFAYMPQNRRDALFEDLSLSENMTVASLGEYWNHGFLSYAAQEAAVAGFMTKFAIRAPAPDTPITTLSGGNQQKAVLARCLTPNPSPGLLLLDEPTQGVDVGARHELWRLIRRAAQAGAGVLVVSSEFEELDRLCDRVLVLSAGRTVAEYAAADFTVERLNRALYGSDGQR